MTGILQRTTRQTSSRGYPVVRLGVSLQARRERNAEGALGKENQEGQKCSKMLFYKGSIVNLDLYPV